MSPLAKMMKSAALSTLAMTTLSLSAAHAAPAACEEGFDMDNYSTSSDAFGSSKFGGAYSMGAGVFEMSAVILATPCRQWEQINTAFADHPDYETMIADVEGIIEALEARLFDRLQVQADAEVTVFRRTRSVVDMHAAVAQDEVGIYLEAMGQTLFDFDMLELPLNAITYVPLFGKSANVDLGIFEISAGAEAAGVIGITGYAQASGASVTANLTPVAGLNVNAEASFSVAGASAGVRGELDVVTLSVPAVGEIDSNSWSLDVDASVDAIAGYLEAFGSLLGAEATVEICSFDGVNLFSANLISAGGAL